MEETPVRFQDLFRRCPTQGYKLGRGYPAFRRVTGLKRLGHCAKVFPESARLARDKAQHIEYFGLFESQQLCARDRRTKRSASARRMKAVLIVPRRNCFR